MSSTDNLSAVLYGVNDLRLEQRPVPRCGPHQLLIRVHTVGICGSDVHYWTHGAIGAFVVKEPLVLGHESSGTVAEVGTNVTGFSVGDRVALEVGVACGRCHHCKKGTYNLCPDMRFHATPPIDGSLARFVVHDASYCFKLPDHVSFEDGSLLEPLNVAVHSCKRGHVTIGQNILICGCGPIGLLNLLTAKAMGVSRVVMTDIDDNRLATAKHLGADIVVNVRGKTEQDLAKEIRTLLGGNGPEVSIECTGVASSIETAIWTTQSGGVIVLVGLGEARSTLPIIEAATREVDIRGVFRYANCYPTALELISSGRVNLNSLSRAHYTLEQTKEAFERSKKGDVIKVFIQCHK
ncbi:alcohol dehydrogenase groES-like domain-containing protein [Ditylenchus destructor]|uniref:Sorbitol dehydrogenase n=1 Tax=Ditylenchus destructor TaxID=166010 RepID=A0AAD4RD92_9BILA|nr:alcohol dehydrogenase groES-like domain-containing protein [Ditylenchus destructor]